MINTLIVEDQSHLASFLRDRLVANNRGMPKFSVQMSYSADNAKIQCANYSFDCIFIDLRLKPEDPELYEGIALCEYIKRQYRSIVTILYSSIITKNNESNFPYYKQCQLANADWIISKEELYNLLSDEIEGKINLFINNYRAKTMMTYNNDFKTLALVERVGDSTLSKIVTTLIPNMTGHIIGALQAGFSGAIVMHVKSSNEKLGITDLQNVIKLSRDPYVLEEEIRRKPESGSYYSSVGITPIGNTIFEVDGWSAILIPSVRNAQLLCSFLQLNPLDDKCKAILHKLVSKLLIHPSLQSIPWNPDLNLDANDFLLKYSAGVNIIEILSAYSRYSDHLDAEQLARINYVNDFVQKSLMGYFVFNPTIHHVAYLHGDFHCKNIFISEDDISIVIDFGRRNLYPRLFDFASLDVDLLVNQLDLEAGKSMNLNYILIWEEIAKSNFPFSPTNTLHRIGNSDRVIYLRHLLLEGLLNNVKNYTDFEYSQVLLFNFLRYLRFDTVSYPKKILIINLIYSLLKKHGL